MNQLQVHGYYALHRLHLKKKRRECESQNIHLRKAILVHSDMSHMRTAVISIAIQ